MIGKGEKNLNLYRKKFQSLCESSEGVAEVYGGLEISQKELFFGGDFNYDCNHKSWYCILFSGNGTMLDLVQDV